VKCELQLLANWWQKTRMKAALSTLAIQRSTDAEMRRCHPRCDVRMADAICYAANTRLQAVWVWENRSGDFHRDYRRQCRSAFWVHLASVLDSWAHECIVPAHSKEIAFINIAYTTHSQSSTDTQMTIYWHFIHILAII